MFNYVFLLNKQYKFDSISLNECNGKLMGGVSRLGNLVVKFWFLTPNDEDVLLFSHQTSSMKHHLIETQEHHFEIQNIVLSSQSISLHKFIN